MTRRLLFDIETDGLLDSVTKTHCIVIEDLDTGVLTSYRPHQIKEALHHLDRADELWGHNILAYDLPALEKVEGWSPLSADIRDTLILSRVIWPDLAATDAERNKRKQTRIPGNLVGSHSLKAWGCRIGDAKGDFGESTDWSEFSEEMLAYCEQDVRLNAKLAHMILDRMPPARCVNIEHSFAWLIHQQQKNGFKIDREKALVLLDKLMTRSEEVEAELQEMFPARETPMKTVAYYLDPEGGKHTTKKAGMAKGWKSSQLRPGPLRLKVTPFNPGSRPQIAERLKEVCGWEPSEITETGQPKIDETTLKTCDHPAAGLLREYLMLAKRLGQLSEGKNAWLKLADDRDVVHGYVNTNGAVTGRCTHSRPNVAQTPKASSSVPFGKDMRELWGPTREGWVQVGCDASGLELRCLAHYLHPWDKGYYAEAVTEGDVHWVHTLAMQLVPGGTERDPHNAEHENARNSSKTACYATLYGSGPEGVGKQLGHDETEAEEVGRRIQENFRSGIVGLQQLTDKAKFRAGFRESSNRGKKCWRLPKGTKPTPLRGLDGRSLPVRSAHAALNTLLQSAGAVIMKMALIEFHLMCNEDRFRLGEDYALLANIHDEFQVECRPEIAERIAEIAVASIQKAGPLLGFRCRLDGEAKIGHNWAECH